MYLTSTGVVVAQLTRKGRQILAENSAAFNITSFRFSDDEINYAFFDGSTVDAPNAVLSNWPILEGCSNGDYLAGQRYTVFSSDNTLVSLAALDTDLGYLSLGYDKGDKRDEVFRALYEAAQGSGPIGHGATNLGGASFTIGQQELRPERYSSEIFVEYDSAIPGQEWNFTVKTLWGNDNAYIVSFPSMQKVFTVNGSYQTVFNSMPDTDPTTTFQNQTQAIITFKLAGDFVTNPAARMAGSAAAGSPDGTGNPWAVATMNIVGQQTGQRFQIRVWLWSRSLVISEWQKRFGGIKPPPPTCPPGFHIENGVCVADTGGGGGTCPPGQHMENGVCVPDITTCPPGFQKDAQGNCVPIVVVPPGGGGGGFYFEYFNNCTKQWQLKPATGACYSGLKRVGTGENPYI